MGTIYPFWGRFKSFSEIRPAKTSGFRHKIGRIEVYAGVLCVTALSLAASLVTAGYRLGAPLLALFALVLIAILAERQSVQVASHTEMSVSVLPILFAAVLFGPLAAMIVGGCALICDFGPPHVRWVVWTSQRALVAGLVGLAASAVPHSDSGFGAVLAAVVAAALIEAAMDGGLAALTAAIRRNNIAETARSTFAVQLGAVPLYTPVLAVLVYTYRQISPWVVLFFFLPALAAQKLFLLYQEQRNLAEDLTRAFERLERANLSFATALVATLDARDRYTAGHSAAVALYSRDIAARMGLPDDEQQLAHVCGLVHDIGKVGLAPGLLEKTGALTLDERRQMEEHAAIGERILSNVEDYAEIAQIVRHHHERVDGHGYPDGLTGETIPVVSRIITVADAYNAMTSDRPYRDAMPSRVARLRLAQAVETQFDTSVVAAFEAILAGATESYRAGTCPNFRFDTQVDARQEEVSIPLAAVS
jgi:putative nucleotidyltransferase with HDIG domain